LQAEVDRLYDLFIEQVAQMRGLDLDAVRATEAGLFYGEQAVAAGLADAVRPLDAVLTEFTEALAAQQRLAQPGVARASPRRVSTQAISNPSRSKAFTLEHTMTDPQDEHEDNGLDPTETTPQGDQPQPDGDPQATPAAQAALAQSFASGRGQAQAQAQAIAELCLIAGQSQRTAEFLAAGFSEAQVRRALLDARADQPDITSRITAEAGTRLLAENSPVVAAVKKLTAKE
jgi:ClpP class serine protease